jgi:hypothetical protein
MKPAVSDFDIAVAMAAWGGSFAQGLGSLWSKADPINQAKIKATWPELWEEYRELLVMKSRQDAECASLPAITDRETVE